MGTYRLYCCTGLFKLSKLTVQARQEGREGGYMSMLSQATLFLAESGGGGGPVMEYLYRWMGRWIGM